MLAILESFCPTRMVGTTRARSAALNVARSQDAVIPAVNSVEETVIPSHPLAGIIAAPEVEQVILEMLHSGISESVIRSIFDTGYYEIVVPPEPAWTPYIAVTYTNDVAEGHIHGLNSQPVQDTIFLTTPKLGMTADERGEYEEDAWDGFQLSSINYYQESGEMDAIPWPVLYTIAEMEDLEPVSGLQIYFSDCDYNSLDPSVSAMNNGVTPWYRSKSFPSSPQVDTCTQEWSSDYELGDLQNLVAFDEDAELEQDSNVSTNSDPESEYADMDWIGGIKQEPVEPSLLFNSEKADMKICA
ncbi:unnamed protein product [Rhizoctonia solani]|uniref:Uncharacterized protein n=1 Tax=Rhizoctonia solani TaxID=456999 RepID=A0A8H3E1Y7_9AGAM|nr:unnamed protein product [Rhizoctonia solani]